MDTVRAKSELAGRRFGHIEWVDSTGSTNSDLLQRARNGEGEQVLGSRHQVSGRGRLGRVWQAPPDASLLCSILVRPELNPTDLGAVTTALGLAAAYACTRVAGVDVGLKWPNDLVRVGGGPDASDRKLAGILAESVVTDGRVDAVVAGIGLNVNWPEPLPSELADIATSLRHEAGHEVDLTDLLVVMLTEFERHLELVRAGGFRALRDDYRERSATLGRTVRVELPSSELVGVAVDVTSTGALVVEDSAAGRHQISAGDVIHLRPVQP
jgi:BirA family biotin operon repressor/biotin-[acetyl-CoA-carboxylase] ligase